jgi:hypothetical protein
VRACEACHPSRTVRVAPPELRRLSLAVESHPGHRHRRSIKPSSRCRAVVIFTRLTSESSSRRPSRSIAPSTRTQSSQSESHDSRRHGRAVAPSELRRPSCAVRVETSESRRPSRAVRVAPSESHRPSRAVRVAPSESCRSSRRRLRRTVDQRLHSLPVSRAVAPSRRMSRSVAPSSPSLYRDRPSRVVALSESRCPSRADESYPRLGFKYLEFKLNNLLIFVFLGRLT